MAVTIGGAYFGPIGMFLGVPVMSILKIMANDYIEVKQKNKDKEQRLKEKEKEKAKEKRAQKKVSQEEK